MVLERNGKGKRHRNSTGTVLTQSLKEPKSNVICTRYYGMATRCNHQGRYLSKMIDVDCEWRLAGVYMLYLFVCFYSYVLTVCLSNDNPDS